MSIAWHPKSGWNFMSEHRKKNRTNFYRSILSNKDFMDILSPDTENDAWRLDIVQKSLWVFEIFFGLIL